MDSMEESDCSVKEGLKLGVFPRTVTDKAVQYPGRYQMTLVSGTTYDLVAVPGTITAAGTPINKAYLQPIEQALYELLLAQDIKGTTQTPTYTTGKITQILHKTGGVTLVRTDTFTYTQPLITEVRTLVTGETLTLKHYFNTDNSFNRTEVS